MKQRFTIQLRGNVDYESEAALMTAMQEVLADFPEFTLTFKSIEVWQNGNGKARLFNDDGTPYVEPVEEEPIVEEEPEVVELNEGGDA